MEKEYLDIKPRPMENIESSLNKPKPMERIITMGNISAKESTELLIALGKLASSIKVSLANDGKFTPADAVNFIDDFMPVVAGISGIGLIPAEFKDGYDAVEQDEMGSALADALDGFEGNVPELAKAGLQVLFSLQNFLIVAGVIKAPEAPVE